MGCTEWRQHQRDLLCVVLIGSDILQYLVIDTEGPKSSCSTLSKASGDEVLDGFAAEVRFFKIFIYLTVLHLSCSMWDLVPWPRIKLRPPALGTQNFSDWTTWEILQQKLGLLQTPGLGLQTGSVGHWVGWPLHQWVWKTLLPLHGSPAAESRISTIPTKKPQPSTFSATSTQNITWINSCKNPKS